MIQSLVVQLGRSFVTNLLAALACIVVGNLFLERFWPANQRATNRLYFTKTEKLWVLLSPFIHSISTPILIAMYAITVKVPGLALGHFYVPLRGSFLPDFGVADQPFWLQIVEMLIVKDFVMYWVHRARHQVPFLWKFHAVHHAPKSISWPVNLMFHPFDLALELWSLGVPVVLLGFSPTAVGAFSAWSMFRSKFNHTNTRIDFGWLDYVFVTPKNHLWHHSSLVTKHGGVNFCTNLAVFDLLFGTYHEPRGVYPDDYGAPGENVPDSFWAQLVYPFRALFRPRPAPASVPSAVPGVAATTAGIVPPADDRAA